MVLKTVTGLFMDASVKSMLIKPRQGLALRLSADKSICLGLMGMFSSIGGPCERNWLYHEET